MPGARVEVLIQRCGQGADASSGDCVDPSQRVEARLRTAGAATGIDDDSGDQWPAVDLASVVFEAAPGGSNSRTGSVLPPGTSTPRSVPEAATLPAAASPPTVPQAPAQPATTCDDRRYHAGPAEFRDDANLVRLIRFNNRDFGEHGGELFGIHAENFLMQDRTGRPV